ncbi:protein FAM234B [Bacillus rossius redtenbacheri]|uniref:protein FAM234B n=1 Tax=Bacillus rossius redtenbacheri TaxID=93214 RepID=UPI002FDDC651
MSGGSTTQKAVYSPLPQTISDTDSSEEELNSVLHSNNSFPVNRKLAVPGKDSAKNGQKMGEYRQLGHDGETDVSLNGLSNQESTMADDILIVKPEEPTLRGFQHMSPLRKLFFFGSVALCGVTVMVFLWVLPCDWATCPSAQGLRARSRSWERTLVGLELKGAISIVPGVLGRSRNLIFMLRGDVGNPSGSNTSRAGVESFPVDGGGIISLIGSTGVIAWWKRLSALPRDIDCSLLDVDNNGVDDCLVLGDKGLLLAIDPVSGAQRWQLRAASGKEADAPTDLDFPLVLPDLDDDGVSDLLTACSLPRQQRNSLVLVSGGSGVSLGRNVQVQACFRVHVLSIENLTVSYICQQGEKEAVREMELLDLYKQATNRMFPKAGTLAGAPSHQHKGYDGRPSVARSLTLSVGGRSLTLENSGRCPLHCRVAVNVTGQGGQLVWNHTAENAHGTVPVAMVFADRSGPVSGFVLKFWQWGARDDLGAHLVAHRLSERVVLIVFNSSDMRVVNTNQSDITQLCSCLDGREEDIDCQPNLSFQEQSLLFGDLDQDGSQKLISYLSTYVSRTQNNSVVWHLESKVRAIRLEAELPKLYEAFTKVV